MIWVRIWLLTVGLWASTKVSTRLAEVVPAARVRYLAEVAESVRGYHAHTDVAAGAVRRRSQTAAVLDLLTERISLRPQLLC